VFFYFPPFHLRSVIPVVSLSSCCRLLYLLVKNSLCSVKDKGVFLLSLPRDVSSFVHFTLYVQLSLFFRSLAGVDVYYLGTRLTLDIAAPVEFTIAVIFDNLPFRVVSSSTTHDTA